MVLKNLMVSVEAMHSRNEPTRPAALKGTLGIGRDDVGGEDAISA